ncbi:MAG: hypothetical protein IJH78_04940 [Clostridia bacterium]|nr:hypothetical protein [Clostridia bacterium]
MDIQAMVEKVLAAVKGDKGLLSTFTSNPVQVIERILGKDLPDDVVNKVIDGVKKALGNKAAGGILAWIKGLFGKK